MGKLVLNKYLESYLSSIPEISKNFSKCLEITQCSIFGLILLPLISTLTIIVITGRTFINLYYRIFQPKYSLACATDSAFAAEKQANRMSINTFVYVKGQPNLKEIQERFAGVLNNPKFSKFKQKLIKKWGFYTWELEKNFDISRHVKYFPGINLQKTYTEQEVLENVENLVDNQFSPNSPQWELLIVPKVKTDNGVSLNSQYAFVYRVHHAYMDGISLMQIFKKLIDHEHNKNALTIDPVHIGQKLKPLTVIELFLHYLQVVLLGPYTIFKSTRIQTQNTFQYMTENKGPKFIGCSNGMITMDTIKEIRKTFNCSTTAIFNSAVTAALRKAAIRKGLEIPEEVDFGFTLAMLPYPDDSPQNRFTIGIMKSPVGLRDPVQRLNSLNDSMKSLTPYEVSTLYCLGKVIGYYPYFVIEKIFECMHSGYVFSNLPGFADEIKLFGEPVTNMYGCPPIKNGVAFGIGVNSYKGKFQACFVVEKSHIIGTKEEIRVLIADFEKELVLLENIANKNIMITNKC